MSYAAIASAVALVLVAILILPAVVRRNAAPGVALRNLAIWLAIALGIALLYRFLA